MFKYIPLLMMFSCASAPPIPTARCEMQSPNWQAGFVAPCHLEYVLSPEDGGYMWTCRGNLACCMAALDFGKKPTIWKADY